MEIQQKIKQAGLKLTPQRREVYKIMRELAHAPIEGIIEKMSEQNPDITVSTIYRILNCFCDNDLLSRVQHPSGKIYYDINTHEHCHKVTPTQDLIDIEDDELLKLIRQRISLKLSNDEQIDKITIQITTKN